jgi:hypothetical protein
MAARIDHHDSIRQHEISRLQSAGQRTNDARPNHQLCSGYQIEGTARCFGRASMADPVSNCRKRFAAYLRAKALQAVEAERCAITQPPLERRDLSRERIKEQNQFRDLILAFRNDA